MKFIFSTLFIAIFFTGNSFAFTDPKVELNCEFKQYFEDSNGNITNFQPLILLSRIASRDDDSELGAVISTQISNANFFISTSYGGIGGSEMDPIGDIEIQYQDFYTKTSIDFHSPHRYEAGKNFPNTLIIKTQAYQVGNLELNRINLICKSTVFPN